jgi:hypothetical protein
MASLCDLVPPGVVTGDDLMTLLEHARTNGYAIPAVNCTRYVPKSVQYWRPPNACSTSRFLDTLKNRIPKSES